MPAWLRSTGQFIRLVVWNKWATPLLSLDALVGIYIRLAPTDWPFRSTAEPPLMSALTLVWIAIAILILSAIIVFHEQRMEIERLERENVPNITGELEQFVTFSRKGEREIGLIVYLRVQNIGQQTSLHNWRVGITMADGSGCRVKKYLLPEIPDMRFPHGASLEIDEKDQIEEKTSTVIEPGDHRRGIILCGVFVENENALAGARMTVHCRDMWGREHEFSGGIRALSSPEEVIPRFAGYGGTRLRREYDKDESERRVVKDQRLWLTELFGHSNLLEGYSFENCEILGPGTIRFARNVEIEGGFGFLYETGSIRDHVIIPEDYSKPTYWAFHFSDTKFTDCTFIRISFYSSSEDFTDWITSQGSEHNDS